MAFVCQQAFYSPRDCSRARRRAELPCCGMLGLPALCVRPFWARSRECSGWNGAVSCGHEVDMRSSGRWSQMRLFFFLGGVGRQCWRLEGSQQGVGVCGSGVG